MSALALVLACLAAEAALRAGGYAPPRARGARRLSDDERRVALDCYADDRGSRSRSTSAIRRRAHATRPWASPASKPRRPRTRSPSSTGYNSLGFRDAEVGPKRDWRTARAGARRLLHRGPGRRRNRRLPARAGEAARRAAAGRLGSPELRPARSRLSQPFTSTSRRCFRWRRTSWSMGWC